MSTQHYSVYRLSDGQFTGQQIGIPMTLTESQREHCLKLPDGLAVKLGRFDHLSQKVDTSTQDHGVVDYQPPQPSEEHEWNAATRRWQFTALALQRRALLEQIEAIESLQPRALREAVLGGNNTRLQDIDNRIASLRFQLTRLGNPEALGQAPCKESEHDSSK